MSDSSDPMDCSLPGSSVHGILQARTLECVAISYSGDLPDPGIEPGSSALQADSLPAELWGKPQYILLIFIYVKILHMYYSYESHIYENMQEEEDKVAYKLNNLDNFYSAFSVVHTILTFKVYMI